MAGTKSLKIVHCFRSPVGGIFRHVRDLVAGQSAAGHEVGILCDSSTGGALEDALFEAIMPQLKLGLTRIPMERAITPRDLKALAGVYRRIKALRPDVIHAHGSKGGAYGRIIGTIMRLSGNKVARIYCPHGGSIHYDSATANGWLFFMLERLLRRMTDRLIFVSKYEADGYADKIGIGSCPVTIAYNGLARGEFTPVPSQPDARDFGYVGMMRDLKGPDLFLESIARIREETGRDITAIFVGDGPDKAKYRQAISTLGLDKAIDVFDPTPAREVFAKAKVIVVPSRAESMPYIVLEAIAAQKPLVATGVGGIPEIFDGSPQTLVPPGDAHLLADAMVAALDDPERESKAALEAVRIQGRFSVATMNATIEDAYRKSL